MKGTAFPAELSGVLTLQRGRSGKEDGLLGVRWEKLLKRRPPEQK